MKADKIQKHFLHYLEEDFSLFSANQRSSALVNQGLVQFHERRAPVIVSD